MKVVVFLVCNYNEWEISYFIKIVCIVNYFLCLLLILYGFSIFMILFVDFFSGFYVKLEFYIYSMVGSLIFLVVFLVIWVDFFFL